MVLHYTEKAMYLMSEMSVQTSCNYMFKMKYAVHQNLSDLAEQVMD